MKFSAKLIFSIILLTSIFCKGQTTKNKQSDFVISFGSCNNQYLPNKLWKEISKSNPDIWIWGGDVIYSDTENMKYLSKNYQKQKNNKHYNLFAKNIEILGTWDDHDYGINDGGTEYTKKNESQQLFLDFLNVPKKDKRRTRKGVYYSKEYKVQHSIIKIIILDTRYFRTPLTRSSSKRKRYTPSNLKTNSMLGETQWKWLKNELTNSKANYTIIMSSVQFLSYLHGFESWGNMPNEVKKLEDLLAKTNTKNAIILSGDRHISEISSKKIKGLNYPLIDFTSSGLTHSYTSYSGELNPYRIVDVVSKKSFGLLKFNLNKNEVTMEIRGEKNILYNSYIQKYNE